jgi:hypothetical protein
MLHAVRPDSPTQPTVSARFLLPFKLLEDLLKCVEEPNFPRNTPVFTNLYIDNACPHYPLERTIELPKQINGTLLYYPQKASLELA